MVLSIYMSNVLNKKLHNPHSHTWKYESCFTHLKKMSFCTVPKHTKSLVISKNAPLGAYRFFSKCSRNTSKRVKVHLNKYALRKISSWGIIIHFKFCNGKQFRNSALQLREVHSESYLTFYLSFHIAFPQRSPVSLAYSLFQMVYFVPHTWCYETLLRCLAVIIWVL